MPYELIAIGASWGGLHALERVLGGLPPDFAPALVVAQHRAADSGEGVLTRALASRSPLPVCEAGDKDPIRPGQVHLAPPDYHLLVEPGTLALSVEGPVRFSRPSIDVTLESAGDAYGKRAIGVILTGATDDGALGLRRMRDCGALTIVQDPDTAERAEMPAAAIAAGAAQRVVPLEGIAAALVEACAGRRAA
jgi:two-component system chemotaxis response regulator CheB